MTTLHNVQISVEQDTVRIVLLTRSSVGLSPSEVSGLIQALEEAREAARVNDRAMRAAFAARGSDVRTVR